MKRDWLPLLLIPALMIGALPLIGSPASWVTLTVAGLAMGLMIFIMASGLTLTFGLMDVLNFGMAPSSPWAPLWLRASCWRSRRG